MKNQKRPPTHPSNQTFISPPPKTTKNQPKPRSTPIPLRSACSQVPEPRVPPSTPSPQLSLATPSRASSRNFRTPGSAQTFQNTPTGSRSRPATAPDDDVSALGLGEPPPAGEAAPLSPQARLRGESGKGAHAL